MSSMSNKAAELRKKVALEKKKSLEEPSKSSGSSSDSSKPVLKGPPRVTVTAVEDGKKRRERLLGNFN